MAHPFIACDFEMWNDAEFRYEVLKRFISSRIEPVSKYESALKYNTEDWYIEVDLIDSIAACMMLIGQTDESLQKFAWLLQTLAEDDVKDAETKFQLCNNLACVLNSETEEEIEYKESLFDLVKDDAAVLSYAIHYLDDWLPDSAE